MSRFVLQSRVGADGVLRVEVPLGAAVLRSAQSYQAANQKLVNELRIEYTSMLFDDAAAIDAAQLRAQLASIGKPIGPCDLLIAAIARTHRMTLVTNNTAEFALVPDLGLAEWQSGG